MAGEMKRRRRRIYDEGKRDSERELTEMPESDRNPMWGVWGEAFAWQVGGGSGGGGGRRRGE